MNNRISIVLLLLFLSFPGSAQDVTDVNSLQGDSIISYTPLQKTASRDTILLQPTWPIWEYFNFTPLHTGLNASLSLFSTIGLGHGSPRGAGFGKDISLAYVRPLGSRWCYTLATDMHNLKWGGFQWNQMIVGGELNYACNDRLSFSVFGCKELVHPLRTMPSLYYYTNPFMVNHDNYVGGAINMKFNDNIFLQVSFGTGAIKYP